MKCVQVSEKMFFVIRGANFFSSESLCNMDAMIRLIDIKFIHIIGLAVRKTFDFVLSRIPLLACPRPVIR